jgi:acyl carrier protein phosphodiesterase
MNFLAHFHLAWPDAGLVAGGLEGDYCGASSRKDSGATLASSSISASTTT